MMTHLLKFTKKFTFHRPFKDSYSELLCIPYSCSLTVYKVRNFRFINLKQVVRPRSILTRSTISSRKIRRTYTPHRANHRRHHKRPPNKKVSRRIENNKHDGFWMWFAPWVKGSTYHKANLMDTTNLMNWIVNSWIEGATPLGTKYI